MFNFWWNISLIAIKDRHYFKLFYLNIYYSTAGHLIMLADGAVDNRNTIWSDANGEGGPKGLFMKGY